MKESIEEQYQENLDGKAQYIENLKLKMAYIREEMESARIFIDSVVWSDSDQLEATQQNFENYTNLRKRNEKCDL